MSIELLLKMILQELSERRNMTACEKHCGIGWGGL
jgi:hypothetical protein